MYMLVLVLSYTVYDVISLKSIIISCSSHILFNTFSINFIILSYFTVLLLLKSKPFLIKLRFLNLSFINLVHKYISITY